MRWRLLPSGSPPAGPDAEEVAGHVQIGTRMLGRTASDANDGSGGEPRGGEPRGGEGGAAEPVGEHAAARQPGADGTLLAVVPIPGTGTSLAIVGYPVTAQGSTIAAGTVGMSPIPQALMRDGPVFDGTVSGGTVSDGPVLDGPVLDGTVLNGAVFGSTAAAGQAGSRRPGLLLDRDQRRVWVDGAEVTLTFQEFELLAFLAAHPVTVFSRADLVREVWQRDFGADSRTVDVHVSRLRRKLGPSYGRCLVTEYRAGYQFRPMA
jgi:Transcriptional regulatory protein, C terminal